MLRFFSLAIVLLVTLCFGLWPFNFRSRNDVAWLPEAGALAFHKKMQGMEEPVRGLAVVEGAGVLPVNGPVSFFLEASSPTVNGGLGYLFALEDKEGRTLFSISQWHDMLEVKRANKPYDQENGFQFLSAGGVFGKAGYSQLLVTLENGRTRIYVDGKLVGSRKGTRVFGPDELAEGLTLVGNDGAGGRPFVGALKRLSVYATALKPKELAAGTASPVIDYDFNVAPEGDHYASIGSANAPLWIPELFHPARRRFLRGVWRPYRGLGWNWSDMRVNFFGFLPLGIVSTLALSSRRASAIRLLLMATFISAATSLAIESAQCFLPTRYSSSLDLLLNTVGGFAGAAIYLVAKNWRRRKRPPYLGGSYGLMR